MITQLENSQLASLLRENLELRGAIANELGRLDFCIRHGLSLWPEELRNMRKRLEDATKVGG